MLVKVEQVNAYFFSDTSKIKKRKGDRDESVSEVSIDEVDVDDDANQQHKPKLVGKNLMSIFV